MSSAHHAYSLGELPGRSDPAAKSAFDDEELTELGKQFVHYTMNEIVPRIRSS